MSEGGRTDAAPGPRLRRGDRASVASPRLKDGGAPREDATADKAGTLRSAAPQALDRDFLLYDHFKHLTTMALLALGGVLALSRTTDFGNANPMLIVGALVLVGLAAVTAFIGASAIVRSRHAGVEVPSQSLYRLAAPSLLLLGVGIFLYLFVDGLIR